MPGMQAEPHAQEERGGADAENGAANSCPPSSVPPGCDWNEVARSGRPISPRCEFLDETLRDGLQNPSVVDPSIEKKIELLHIMNDLGIAVANVGLPGSNQRAFDDCLVLCKEVARHNMKIKVSAAGRTVVADLLPMVELSQRSGIPVEPYTFVGCSPIRAVAEAWDLNRIKQLSIDAIDVCVKNGLETTFVTEDTTRSRPEVLGELFKCVLDHGVSGLCLCDTVGHSTHDGVANLIRFTRNLISSLGHKARIDWHGHNDRGLSLTNAIYALEMGADRVHGTALGIGERVGNAPMELILLNLKMLGVIDQYDLSRLAEYCEKSAEAMGWTVPPSYPFVGTRADHVGVDAVYTASDHDTEPASGPDSAPDSAPDLEPNTLQQL